MDPRERDMLRKSLELAEENHAMLKKIRRGQKLGMFIKTFYWIIIIGAAVSAYIAVQPVLSEVGQTYDGFQDNINSATQVIESLREAL